MLDASPRVLAGSLCLERVWRFETNRGVGEGESGSQSAKSQYLTRTPFNPAVLSSIACTHAFLVFYRPRITSEPLFNHRAYISPPTLRATVGVSLCGAFRDLKLVGGIEVLMILPWFVA